MAQDFSAMIDRMMYATHLKNHTALARKLGVTPQAISNYKGRGKMPTDLVIRLAEIYGLSVDWLLFGAGEPFKDVEGVEQGARVFLSKEDA